MPGVELSVESMTKRFGGLVAVSDVSFQVPAGRIVGLIGPNGAGKTTVFNCISGLYRADSGSVRLGGRELVGMNPHGIATAGLGRTFQNIRLFKGMDCLQQVATALHGAATYGLMDTVFRSRRFKKAEADVLERARLVLDEVGLGALAESDGASLAYGLQRRLEIARALALNPKVLLLDEPAAGLNPRETGELVDLIAAIRQSRGVTVLLIEHHMDLVQEICESIVVLNFGHVIAAGISKEIQENKDVIEAYLGDRRGK